MPLPKGLVLPVGYQPNVPNDPVTKSGEWQCPVIGCVKKYMRKRTLMDHLAKFHKDDKLVDTIQGTFAIKPKTADGSALLSATGQHVQSPADDHTAVFVQDDASPPPVQQLNYANISSNPPPQFTAHDLDEFAYLDEDMPLLPPIDEEEFWDDELTYAELLPIAISDFASDSDSDSDSSVPLLPLQPLQKKRKTTGKTVAGEHRYAPLSALRDEELRRQIERREQGFVSDVEVARDAGGLMQGEGADLLDEVGVRRVFGRWVREGSVERVTGWVGGKEGEGGMEKGGGVGEEDGDGASGIGNVEERDCDDVEEKEHISAAAVESVERADKEVASTSCDETADKNIGGENEEANEAPGTADFVRSARAKWLALL